MRVAVLERPAAGAHVRPPLAPVASHLELLQRLQPARGRASRRAGLAMGLRRPRPPAAPGSRARCPRPGKRRAGSRLRRRRPPAACRSIGGPWRVAGMIRRIAQRIEHHHRVRHGGIDRAKAVLAVQPLGDEACAALDGATAHLLRPQRLDGLQHLVERVEEQRPAAVRMRSRPGGDRVALANSSWMAMPRGLRARRRSAASTSSGTMTVRAQ